MDLKLQIDNLPKVVFRQSYTDSIKEPVLISKFPLLNDAMDKFELSHRALNHFLQVSRYAGMMTKEERNLLDMSTEKELFLSKNMGMKKRTKKEK